jgi:hypothetical protein
MTFWKMTDTILPLNYANITQMHHHNNIVQPPDYDNDATSSSQYHLTDYHNYATVL